MSNRRIRLAFFTGLILLIILGLGLFYIYSQHKSITEEYKKAYDFREELSKLVDITDRSILQRESENIFGRKNGQKFFIDSLNGMIWVHHDKSIIGQLNSAPYGEDGSIAFESVKNAVLKKKKEFINYAYVLPKGVNQGIIYYDPDRKLIFGLVADKSYLEIVIERKINNAFLATTIVLFLAILAIIMILFYLKNAFSFKETKIEELELAVHSTPLGVAIMSSDTTIVWTNKVFDGIYGETYLNKKLLDLSGYSRINEIVEECMIAGKAEYRNGGTSSNNQKVISSVSLNKYKFGEEDRILLISQDITDVIHTYEIIAHDIKAPLTAPRMAASILIEELEKRDLDSKTLVEHLTRIHAGIVASEVYARSLELWGKYQSGSINEISQKVSLNTFFESLNGTFKSTFFEHQINAQFDIESNLYIETDKRSLEAVMRNLLTNSIRALENSTIKEITITAYKIKNDLIIKFHDTGKGMNKSDSKLLFEDTSEFKGLGTYIASKFVTRLRGEIYVENSILNRGTTIVLKIPYKK